MSNFSNGIVSSEVSFRGVIVSRELSALVSFVGEMGIALHVFVLIVVAFTLLRMARAGGDRPALLLLCISVCGALVLRISHFADLAVYLTTGAYPASSVSRMFFPPIVEIVTFVALLFGTVRAGHHWIASHATPVSPSPPKDRGHPATKVVP